MLNATTHPQVTLGQTLIAGAFRQFLVLFGQRAAQPAPRHLKPGYQAQRLYPISPARAHLYARAADEAWS
jgi:hypothetical protein